MTDTPPLTPAAISGAISASPDLTDEGPLALLLAYRSAKHRTGCPIDLENEVVRAARRAEDARAALHKHLAEAHGEATLALSDLAAQGTKFSRNWHALDGRKTAERLGEQLIAARQRFNSLLTAWAIVADRIQATEDEQRTALRERWESRPTRVMRSSAKAAGVSGGKARETLLAALVANRVEPPEP